MKKFTAEDQNMNAIGMILSILSITIVFWLFYSYFFNRKYYLNRKLLIKDFRNLLLIDKKPLMINSRIIQYKFEYFNDIIEIWEYLDENTINMTVNGGYDYIGLFKGDLLSIIQTKKIIKLLNYV